MQISKWGNSLAVRLPAKLVEALGLREGDNVELVARDDGALAVERRPSADDLFERLRQFQGRMPADYKFDRDDANSRDRD